MPTYAYRCTACEHRFEQFQRMTDDPLTDCPECAGAVKRVIHPVGVVFKGSGWYINDSRKPTSDGKTDVKPESTADSGDGPKASDTAKSAATEPTVKKSDNGAAKSEPAKTGGAKSETKPTAAVASR